MKTSELKNLLDAVERLVSDDLCEDLDFAVAMKRVTSLDGTKAIHRLTQIYKLVHSRTEHICDHEQWRESTESLLKKPRTQ